MNVWILVAGFFMSSDSMSMTQEEIFKLQKEECRQCRKQEYELLKAWKHKVDLSTNRGWDKFSDMWEYSEAYRRDHPFDFNTQRDFGSIKNFKQLYFNFKAYLDEMDQEMSLNHDSLECKKVRERYEGKVRYCKILESEINLELTEHNE